MWSSHWNRSEAAFWLFTVYAVVVRATLSVESQMSQIEWVLLEISVHWPPTKMNPSGSISHFTGTKGDPISAREPLVNLQKGCIAPHRSADVSWGVCGGVTRAESSWNQAALPVENSPANKRRRFHMQIQAASKKPLKDHFLSSPALKNPFCHLFSPLSVLLPRLLPACGFVCSVFAGQPATQFSLSRLSS